MRPIAGKAEKKVVPPSVGERRIGRHLGPTANQIGAQSG
jgi:hypothetical protein